MFRLTYLGSQGNDAGESLLTCPRLFPTTKTYEQFEDKKLDSHYVALCAETLAVIQVTQDKKLIEYRLLTMWDYETLKQVPHYKTLLEIIDNDQVGDFIEVSDLGDEARQYESKEKLGTLSFSDANDSLCLFDICYATNEKQKPIAYEKIEESIPLPLIYGSSAVSSRTRKKRLAIELDVYQLQDKGAFNPTEYRLSKK